MGKAVETAAILSCRNLVKEFGGIQALRNISFDIREGSVHGLIGPNGSGKTTLFNVVSGVFPATSGEIFFRSQNITRLPPYAITRLGIGRTFQKAHLIPTLTCLDNVMVGLHCRTRQDLLGTYLRLPFSASRQEKKARSRAEELLEFVGLADHARRWGGELAWIETQLLQIARALACEPRLLLLDEPSAGMGEGETERIVTIVRQIRQRGVTVILVAHNVKLVGLVSDTVTAINFGVRIGEGTPQQVLSDPKVAEAYLGKR